MAAARVASSTSTHAKLHKRASSASSIHSPLSPQSTGGSDFSFKRSETPLVTYEEPHQWTDPARPLPAAANPIKIKPYLRKLSTKDSDAIDLSRPAAENESITGLGISDYSSAHSASDVAFTPLGGRNRHRRSASNTSQFSTSSIQRPTAPYVHPMRQTPRPYTPPTAKSYNNSMLGSEHGEERDEVLSSDGAGFRQASYEAPRRSESFSSIPAMPPMLHLNTSGTLPNTANASQTSLPGTARSSRVRRDTMRSLDTTTSPSSRTSLDRAFTFVKGKESPVDPASRAASIRAARLAYQEKEEAKERKLEQDALKQAHRDKRKKSKQHERQRKQSDAQERPKLRTNLSSEKTPEEIGGREYSAYNPAHDRSLPLQVPTLHKDGARREAGTSKRPVQSGWLSFVTWFRTRLLRLSCI